MDKALKRTLLLAAIVLAVCWRLVFAGPTVIYVSQNAQTPFTGGNNCNGKNTFSVASFNGGAWSVPITVYLCGTITSAIVPPNGGTVGNLMTIVFDTGASIQMPALPTSGGINLSGLSYVVVDGGGGNCGFVNQQSNITCSTGFIESTANGTGLANQIASVGINANSTSNVEIKGLLIGPIYQHTSTSDTTQSAPGPEGISFQSATSLNVHNDTIHDCAWCLTGVGTTLTFEHNEVYNVDHGVGIGGTNSGITIAFNHFHDYANWDQSNNAFHHDGVHLFSTGTNTFNGANVYANLFDGDQGANLTSPGMYIESASTGATIENIVVADNVVLTHSGRLSCCGLVGFYTTAGGATATNGTAINNVLIGYYFAGTGACLDAVGWSNVTFENNLVQGCQNQVTIDAASSITAVDYNDYDNLSSDQSCGAGCNTFSWHGSIFASFATWKTDCSCDSHGRNDTVTQVSLNGVGRPFSGSTVLGNGVDLTGMGSPITTDFLTLNWPSSGAWNIGGYSTQVPSPTSSTGAIVGTL